MFIKEEPLYTWPVGAEDGAEVVIPPGHVLVFGDNRNDSNDGHRWAIMRPDGIEEPRPFLPVPNVLGKAMVIFWPAHRVGLLD